jgi:3-oxoacyl-[acyl-carrier protein] reductase
MENVALGGGRTTMVNIDEASRTGNTGNPLEKRLVGKVALVTGGSRGIGKAIAARLAALGAAVAICGRNEVKLQETRSELETSGARALAMKADVTSRSEIAALISKTEGQLGAINILVNSAGIGMFGAVQEKTEQDWDLVMNTNLKSVFLVCREVVPRMIAAKKGDIINISSLAGKNVFAGGGLYCATKWGLQGLSGCMAEDLRGHGIRVSVICPGSVATEFAGRGPKDAAKVLQAEDVAHAVAMVLTQGPQSFISEVQLRPVAKP